MFKCPQWFLFPQIEKCIVELYQWIDWKRTQVYRIKYNRGSRTRIECCSVSVRWNWIPSWSEALSAVSTSFNSIQFNLFQHVNSLTAMCWFFELEIKPIWIAISLQKLPEVLLLIMISPCSLFIFHLLLVLQIGYQKISLSLLKI